VMQYDPGTDFPKNIINLTPKTPTLASIWDQLTPEDRGLILSVMQASYQPNNHNLHMGKLPFVSVGSVHYALYHLIAVSKDQSLQIQRLMSLMHKAGSRLSTTVT